MTESKPIVLGIGELLWDVLTEGRELGGAPANFAFHASRLGAESCIISSVGCDELGDTAIEVLAQHGLSTDFVQRDSEHTTGIAEAQLDDQGIAHFVIHENVAWDHIQCTPENVSLAARSQIACFGSLAQRNAVSHNSIMTLLQAMPADSIRVFDVNLRQNYYSREVIEQSLQLATVFKISDAELLTVTRLLGWQDADPEPLLRRFCQEYQLKMVAYTRGAEGSLLVTPNRTAEHPGLAVKVVDTVGAGDAFTAAMSMALWRGDSLEAINEAANQRGALVCGQKGAMSG